MPGIKKGKQKIVFIFEKNMNIKVSDVSVKQMYTAINVENIS